jgi:fluoroacetyl-CoA thioesterase
MYAVMAADTSLLGPGLEGRIERVVDDSLVTRHVGGEGVFGTPYMILLMEQASHSAVEAFLAPGMTTVGYEVHVRHLAPSFPGATVVATSRLVEVNGNKLRFEVECREGETIVGSGTHKRAVVPVPE